MATPEALMTMPIPVQQQKGESMPTITQLQDKIERLEARIAAAEAANAALREEVKSAATLRTFEQIVFGRSVPPPRHLHPVGTS